jgi:calcineurin-like phosphoesterase family protein
MTVWFTADTHFDHANVIEYSHRPFTNVNEMNEILIKNWNERIKPGDLVYHLGDFAFCKEEEAVKFASRLNGQKYLVLGNHDKRLRKDDYFKEQWIWTKDLADITVGDQRIVLCHYAMHVWNQSHRGAWQLHGHSHGSLKEDNSKLRLDVGVDCWDQAPVDFDTLKRAMSKKEYEPVDHHGRRDDG